MKNEGIVSGVKKIFERDENGESHALENTIALLGSTVKALEKQVDEIGSYKGKIDTRLQVPSISICIFVVSRNTDKIFPRKDSKLT